MIQETNVDSQILEIIKFASSAGFLICLTLIAGLNFKIFKSLLKDKFQKFWWVFVISSVFPLLVFLFIFTVLFERQNPIKRVMIFKDGKPVVNVTEIKASDLKFVSPSDIVQSYIKNRNKEGETTGY